nr:LUD domain-containing protein [Parafrankia irregularis]
MPAGPTGPVAAARLGGPAAAARATGPTAAARAEILARVRTALGDRPDPAPVSRDYRLAGQGSASLPAGAAPGTAVQVLIDRLLDYHALVRRLPAATAASSAGPSGLATGGSAEPPSVAGAVAAALAERGVRRLVRPAGLPASWLAELAQLAELPEGVELLDDDPPLSVRDLDAADGVITGCVLAIAETGTIVLDGGPGQGRRALTLIPDYHLVVVREDQIVASVADAIAHLDGAGATRPLTWISGPSATSDIELNRVEGVHGPRTLEVIIVHAAAGQEFGG